MPSGVISRISSFSSAAIRPAKLLPVFRLTLDKPYPGVISAPGLTIDSKSFSELKRSATRLNSGPCTPPSPEIL